MKILRITEISQADNLNATTRLWIQPGGLVYKQYVTWNYTTLRNILSLLVVGRNKKLHAIPQVVTAKKIIFRGPIPAGYLMEYCPGQTLWAFLTGDTVSQSAQRDRFQELAEVISKLPRGIFIGDLHAFNVIVPENSPIRIIDIDGFSFTGNEISCPMAFVPGARQLYPSSRHSSR